ncbi:hypothetical protein ACYZUD_00680 [Pseudomonas sp. XS1P51]
MDQLKNLADERLSQGCIYCGGTEETREHVPSKVFLDSPLPENLPIVSACRYCNNGFSSDEEYLACLIESVVSNSTDPDKLHRVKIANILLRSPALKARLESAKIIVDEQLHYNIEPQRVKNIVLKLARGHAWFELSKACRMEPTSIWWQPTFLLSEEKRDEFEDFEHIELLGEIGSRASQRVLVTQITLQSENGEILTLESLINDWIHVQEGNYRYHAGDQDGEVKIKIVIREYLACEVTWSL